MINQKHRKHKHKNISLYCHEVDVLNLLRSHIFETVYVPFNSNSIDSGTVTYFRICVNLMENARKYD